MDLASASIENEIKYSLYVAEKVDLIVVMKIIAVIKKKKKKKQDTKSNQKLLECILAVVISLRNWTTRACG